MIIKKFKLMKMYSPFCTNKEAPRPIFVVQHMLLKKKQLT